MTIIWIGLGALLAFWLEAYGYSVWWIVPILLAVGLVYSDHLHSLMSKRKDD